MRVGWLCLVSLLLAASSVLLAAPGDAEERFALLVLDLDGEGLHLADRHYAVRVDLDGDGVRECVAWTAEGHSEAFLWEDRDDSRKLDPGELMSFRRMAAFEALEQMDRPEHGGNSDGFLSKHDRAWRQLGLWIDRDHDGQASESELSRLGDRGLLAIDLVPRDEIRIDGGLNLRMGWMSVWRRGKAGNLVRLRLSEVGFEIFASGCS